MKVRGDGIFRRVVRKRLTRHCFASLTSRHTPDLKGHPAPSLTPDLDTILTPSSHPLQQLRSCGLMGSASSGATAYLWSVWAQAGSPVTWKADRVMGLGQGEAGAGAGVGVRLLELFSQQEVSVGLD